MIRTTHMGTQDGLVGGPIHALLRKRWSPRSFSDRPVDPATLRSLFEAARWTPSSFNAQPWSFIVATHDDAEAFNRMLAVLMPQNAQWARNAPVLVLAIARKPLDESGRPNCYAFYDVGQAVAMLTVEATTRDLFAHQMGGFDAERAQELFALPPDFEPAAVIALGYLGEPDALPEPLRKFERAPRKRKPLEEFVFAGRWGDVAPLARGADSGGESKFQTSGGPGAPGDANLSL